MLDHGVTAADNADMAQSDAERARNYRRARGVKPRTLKPHGTAAAIRRHLRTKHLTITLNGAAHTTHVITGRAGNSWADTADLAADLLTELAGTHATDAVDWLHQYGLAAGHRNVAFTSPAGEWELTAHHEPLCDLCRREWNRLQRERRTQPR